MLKKIAFAVAVLCSGVYAQQTAGTTSGTTALDPTQVYTTPNLVLPTVTGSSNSPWVNGVYQDQLTCFAWGNPGYCGPNPITTPGYNINFSYGMTNIYQAQAIANLLPNAGTGLRVNGYNFGFMAKNGNGWDNGQQDYLTAYVTFNGSDGKQVYYKNYDLNSKYHWTTFNYSDTFATPYASKDLSTVQYGFVGYDTNFWAGPYGPEITNINFSLKYSVDTCAINVFSSPTCPGYLDALAKLAPAPTATTTTDPITSTSTSAGNTTAIVTDPVSSTVSVTSTTTVGQPSVVAPVVSAPTATTSTTTASSTTATSASSTQTTKESSGSGGGSTSLALSIISKNSERDAAGSAVAQSAVAQAQQAAATAQQEATSVAASAVSNSLTQNAVSGSSQQSSGNGIRVNNTNSTNFTLQSGLTTMAISSGPQSTNTMMNVQQQNASTSAIVVSSIQPVTIINSGSQQVSNNTATTFVLPLLQPQQPSMTAPVVSSMQTEQTAPTQGLLQNNTSKQTSETYSIVPPNFLTDRTNPLTDIIEAKQQVPQNNTIATVGPSVNKNVGNNEVAGGVDINKMALAPTGYGDYMNFTLKDAAFYAPKEVYKNQRNVDNARALRQMTNDSKHREMIEMQYVR